MKLCLIVSLGVAIVGCGGGGGGGGSSVPSIFVGIWNGTWSSATENGTSTISIPTSGNFTGSIFNATLNESGSISGQVFNNGNINATVDYPSSPAVSGSGTVAMSNGNQTLSGTITLGGVATTFTWQRL